jgi:hypothetical protein
MRLMIKYGFLSNDHDVFRLSVVEQHPILHLFAQLVDKIDKR